MSEFIHVVAYSSGLFLLLCGIPLYEYAPFHYVNVHNLSTHSLADSIWAISVWSYYEYTGVTVYYSLNVYAPTAKFYVEI